MRTLDEILSKQLQDDAFRKEYEAIQSEIDAIRTNIDMDILQLSNKNEMVEHDSIKQINVSKL